MKQCPKCERNLEHNQFYIDRQARSRLSSWCKECIRTRPRDSKRAKLRERYGLELEQYKAMLKEQKHRCAICNKKETQIHHSTEKVTQLSVDHDHKTGAVRGLLCARCNKGLGHFNDEPALIATALEYLQTHKENHGR
jgi:Zn finger protein HypA/HybF involved in hydrogenase expression